MIKFNNQKYYNKLLDKKEIDSDLLETDEEYKKLFINTYLSKRMKVENLNFIMDDDSLIDLLKINLNEELEKEEVYISIEKLLNIYFYSYYSSNIELKELTRDIIEKSLLKENYGEDYSLQNYYFYLTLENKPWNENMVFTTLFFSEKEKLEIELKDDKSELKIIKKSDSLEFKASFDKNIILENKKKNKEQFYINTLTLIVLTEKIERLLGIEESENLNYLKDLLNFNDFNWNDFKENLLGKTTKYQNLLSSSKEESINLKNNRFMSKEEKLKYLEKNFNRQTIFEYYSYSNELLDFKLNKDYPNLSNFLLIFYLSINQFQEDPLKNIELLSLDLKEDLKVIKDEVKLFEMMYLNYNNVNIEYLFKNKKIFNLMEDNSSKIFSNKLLLKVLFEENKYSKFINKSLFIKDIVKLYENMEIIEFIDYCSKEYNFKIDNNIKEEFSLYFMGELEEVFD